MGGNFTQRFGYGGQREITVHEDAPPALRAGLVQIALELAASYTQIREIVCSALRRFPDPTNWTEIPNIRDEVIGLIENCEWYRVYDIAEAFHRYFLLRELGDRFANSLNALFQEEGIGWQMNEGQLSIRGPAEFENAVAGAARQLHNANLGTAQNELEEARRDLSRRPEPDITGAIQHSMTAMETTARVLVNNPRVTLGEILNRQAQALGIPRPLDNSLACMWGFASEMGRHLREGRAPNREEAELLLGTVSTMINYMLQVRHRNQ